MRTTIALYGFLAATAALAGCTKAGKCTRGQEGCMPMQGETLTNRGCDSGLRLMGGVCVEDDEPPRAGTGSPRAGSGGGNAMPDAGPPVECPNDTFEHACEAFCEAFCRNEDLLCVQSKCPAGACDTDTSGSDTGAVYKVCINACQDDPDQAGCGQQLCLGENERECEDFGFEDDKSGVFVAGCFDDDPACVLNEDFGCSDTCGDFENGTNAELANNGVCEDGGKGSMSEETPACPRGTDCSDCGKRVCAPAGNTCDGHGDCCGFYGGGAFCVMLGPDNGTCLATCTETRKCPSGFDCLPVDDMKNYVCAKSD